MSRVSSPFPYQLRFSLSQRSGQTERASRLASMVPTSVGRNAPRRALGPSISRISRGLVSFAAAGVSWHARGAAISTANTAWRMYIDGVLHSWSASSPGFVSEISANAVPSTLLRDGNRSGKIARGKLCAPQSRRFGKMLSIRE